MSKSPNSKPGLRFKLMRSGLMTAVILIIAIAVMAFLYTEHLKGHFHRLTTQSVPPPVEKPAARPGGKDIINLSRLQIQNGASSEFLSSALLPGLGMDVLHITAVVPNKPEFDLLKSVDAHDLDAMLKQQGEDHEDEKLNLLAGYGAPWLAWSSRHPLDKDVLAQNTLLLQSADDAESHAMPDGGDATTIVQSKKTLPGHVPAGVETRMSYLMSGRGIDVNITAINNETAPVPLRLGWMPHFAIAKGIRPSTRLYVPSSTVLKDGKPVDIAGTDLDFSHTDGKLIGTGGLDVTYVKLTRDFLSSGPSVDVKMPDYVIRLVVLSPSVRAIRIVAPQNADWISVIPVADSTDTLADRVAEASGGTSVRGLAAGQTLQYKLRLELRDSANFSKSE